METMKELAVAVGLPESTVRLYRDEFEEFLPPATGEGRRRRYGAETQETLRLISGWKREGKSGGEIRTELGKRARPQERARRRTVEERLDEIVGALRAQASEIALLRAEVAALRESVGRLERRSDPVVESMAELQARFRIQSKG